MKENASKANPRLNRIKIVSKTFRWLIGVYVVAACLLMVACWLGWVQILPGTTKIMFSEHQVYAWPFDIPRVVLALASVKFGLLGFCAVILCRLLRLYEQGKYFTAQNVSFIRFLGYYVVIDWFVTLQLEMQAHETSIFLTQPFTGLVIIFIAWIMDEGRKIQEEQELTV